VVNHFYGGDVLTPLWSIGVEEYFYLIWAPLLKYVKWERLVYFFLAIIIVRLAFSVSIKLFDIGDKVIIALNVLRFEYMALGALGAYYFDKNPLLYQSFWFKKPAQLLLAVLLFGVLFYNAEIKKVITYDGIYHFMTALLFLWLILNVGTNPYNILKISNPIFEYLGKVSYGMYVFHTIVIAIVIKAFDEFFIKQEAYRIFILYSSVVLFTILTAILSYHFLEKPFLNYKKGAKNWSADPQIG
jgi:peptidoglycan/LPS O-acetylase OafA/YrhL